jgi:hypothetical protein
LLDRFEDDRELLVVFLLERFDLARKIAVCIHEPAELHERPHDRDVYFHRSCTAEDAREHCDSLLGECVWWSPTAAMRT